MDVVSNMMIMEMVATSGRALICGQILHIL